MTEPWSHPQTEGPLPKIRLEYAGMEPPPGRQWCATCAVLYMGAISTDPNNKTLVAAMIEENLSYNVPVVNFPLPRHEFYILRIAITVAPSVYFTYPMPVCWVHLEGKFPQANQLRGNPTNGTNLIHGKSYRTKGKER